MQFLSVLLLLLTIIFPVAPPDSPPKSSNTILATVYIPELGGINCLDPCGKTGTGATTIPGMMAACPSGWVGTVQTIVITLHDGSEWWCTDNFGKPEDYDTPVLKEHPGAAGAQWVWQVDFMVDSSSNFEYNYYLLKGWTTEWRVVPQYFYQ